MKPIYEPKGKAKEYGDYALNIYTGCPHRCFYCFAPNVLHKDREAFHTNVEPRTDIVRWYGITLDGIGNGKDPLWKARVDALAEAHSRGIKTWISFEPVTNEREFFINLHLVAAIADKVKIGKLNYHKSDINWAEFGKKAEKLCKRRGIDYYIKESLRAEMERKV